LKGKAHSIEIPDFEVQPFKASVAHCGFDLRWWDGMKDQQIPDN